jgi:hypothetical protein
MAGLQGGARWAEWHMVASIGGLYTVTWCYYVCWLHIEANHRIITEIVERVRKIRESHGQPVEMAR